ncbi:cation:proton antiporter regulatory subunit [Haloferacaceae archaeon DSL9]
MDIYETDLPGVGKRFELPLGDGEAVIVVVHNSGVRELFYRPTEAADADEWLKLNDSEARALGAILEGVHFQPVPTDTAQTMLGGDSMLEWYTLGADSPIVDETLEEAHIRRRTGVTIIAVQRGDEVFPSPDAAFRFEADDVLIAIGTGDDHAKLESLLGRNE